LQQQYYNKRLRPLSRVNSFLWREVSRKWDNGAQAPATQLRGEYP